MCAAASLTVCKVSWIIFRCAERDVSVLACVGPAIRVKIPARILTLLYELYTRFFFPLVFGSRLEYKTSTCSAHQMNLSCLVAVPVISNSELLVHGEASWRWSVCQLHNSYTSLIHLRTLWLVT